MSRARGAGQRAAGVVAVALWLLAAPGQALAQCEGASGASDQYCETIPEAGGSSGRPTPRPEGGIPAPTAAALDRAGAGAVRGVKAAATPRRAARAKLDADQGSALPDVLAVLLIALLLAALVRRLRSAPAATDAGAAA